MSTTTPTKPSSVCAGDTCSVRGTWPLHHVRHRGELRRLCTSCVLKYHPGSFCCICYAFPEPTPPSPATVHCSKCPSICHVSCLQKPNFPSSQFVCPCCKHGEGFNFFPVEPNQGWKCINLADAKVLHVAAKLAVRSMSRAAVSARADAEKKAKEAAVARKRAREMLEKAIAVSKDKESIAMGIIATVATAVPPEPPKKKAAIVVATPPPAPTPPVPKVDVPTVRRTPPTPKVDVSTVRRTNNIREVDKWLKFHELNIHKDSKPGFKVGSLKEGVVNSAVSADKGKKGAAPVVQVKDEKAAVVDPEKGSRKPRSNQDALSSRTNSKVIFTGSTSTGILHS